MLLYTISIISIVKYEDHDYVNCRKFPIAQCQHKEIMFSKVKHFYPIHKIWQ